MARHRLSVFESKDSRYHGNQSLIDANFHVIWNKQPRHMFFLCAESHLWILPSNGYHGNVVGGRKCKSIIVALRTYDVERQSFLPKLLTEFSLPL